MATLDYSGYILRSSKSSVAWTAKSLPNGYSATNVELGANDDLCVTDSNGWAWGLKSGYTTYSNITGIPELALKLACYSYGSNAMALLGESGSVYFYGTGSFSRIIDGSTNPMTDVCIAADGTIQTVNSDGTRFLYSGGVLSTQETGKNYYQLHCSLTYTDLVAVSDTYPFLDYRMASGSMSEFSTAIQWLSVYNGNVIGTDGVNVLVWS